MRSPSGILRVLGWYLLLPAALANAHSVRQRLSSYEDELGVSRTRASLSLGMQFNHSRALSATGYSLDVRQDVITDASAADKEYVAEHYGLGEQRQTAGNFGMNQTWNRLTTTRQMVGASTDSVVKTNSYGVGASHWLLHETLQLGIDVSRTVVNRPAYEYLGADSDMEYAPPQVDSTGVAGSIKHLASPTTVLNYGVTHVETNNRPPTNIYSAGIKQFVPPSDSAVHLDVVRAVNKGRITNYTDYGQVSAWSGEVAFLQALWPSAHGKVFYRYYQEDEVTRVEQTELVRGSDTAGVHLSQEIPKGTIDSLNIPLVIEAAFSRYFTNAIDDDGTKNAATMVEGGVLAKF